jgi:hypothetical protein
MCVAPSRGLRVGCLFLADVILVENLTVTLLLVPLFKGDLGGFHQLRFRPVIYKPHSLIESKRIAPTGRSLVIGRFGFVEFAVHFGGDGIG